MIYQTEYLHNKRKYFSPHEQRKDSEPLQTWQSTNLSLKQSINIKASSPTERKRLKIFDSSDHFYSKSKQMRLKLGLIDKVDGKIVRSDSGSCDLEKNVNERSRKNRVRKCRIFEKSSQNKNAMNIQKYSQGRKTIFDKRKPNIIHFQNKQMQNDLINEDQSYIKVSKVKSLKEVKQKEIQISHRNPAFSKIKYKAFKQLQKRKEKDHKDQFKLRKSSLFENFVHHQKFGIESIVKQFSGKNTSQLKKQKEIIVPFSLMNSNLLKEIESNHRYFDAQNQQIKKGSEMKIQTLKIQEKSQIKEFPQEVNQLHLDIFSEFENSNMQTTAKARKIEEKIDKNIHITDFQEEETPMIKQTKNLFNQKMLSIFLVLGSLVLLMIQILY